MVPESPCARIVTSCFLASSSVATPLAAQHLLVADARSPAQRLHDAFQLNTGMATVCDKSPPVMASDQPGTPNAFVAAAFADLDKACHFQPPVIKHTQTGETDFG